MKSLSIARFSPSYKGFFLNLLHKPNLKKAEGKRLRVVFFIFLCISLANFILAAEKIDINAASHEELQKIIWVGPVIAQRIINARPFYSLDEIIEVSGIGEKKLEDIKKQGLAWAGPAPGVGTETSSAAIGEKQFAEPIEPEDTLKTGEEKDDPANIDINAASLQELQEIVGIGAVLGQRIIDMRPFYSLDELAKARGIGTAILKNIKDQGLAWVNPELTPPKEERVESSNKDVAAAPVLSRQTREKQSPRSFFIFLGAFILAFSSGIIILILKKNLKTIS